jgi:subtilisin family serine protease
MSEPGPPTEGHDHSDEPPVPPLPDRVGQADHQFGGGYLYVRGEVIVDSADLGRFRAAIEPLDLAPADPVQTSVPGLVLYPVAGRAGSPAENDAQLIPRLVTELRSREADPRAGLAPIRVWPHHVLAGTSHARGITVGPPVPAEPLDDILNGKTLPGAGVTVAVLDTGLIDPAPDWFRGCVGVMRGPQDLEELRFDPTAGVDRRLASHAGHGSFVAGIVRRHAPGARILVRKVLDERGIVTDHDLSTALLELLDLDVQLVNLSLGGYGHGTGGLPLTEAAIETLRVKRPDLVIVAGAGNDGVEQPFYPAALKDVIGVAALDRHGARACFSNYGPWVDAATAGVRAVSTFFDVDRVTLWPAAAPDCLGEGDPGEVNFHGFAAWSGTSAAAPRVTGAIAAAMGPGVDARQAAFGLVGSSSAQLEVGLGAIVQPPHWG